MAVLLLLAYAAICVLIFKILRVPLNRWTVTTAAIGGVVVVGGLLAGMNYNHPFTTDARIYFYTTPIVPTVKGEVVAVGAKPNVPLKQGQSLFRIDPKPYQYIVDQKRAASADGPAYAKASADAALELARLSQSDHLVQLLTSFAHQIGRYTRLGLLSEARRKRSLQLWARLFDAIRARQATAAEMLNRQLALENRDAALKVLETRTVKPT